MENKALSIKQYINNTSVKSRIESLLQDRAPQFITTVTAMVNANSKLAECEPNSLITSALTATALNLPINQNLGFAWIIPYKSKDGNTYAQFQMGYKGFVQLAMRSGEFKKLDVVPVYEGDTDESVMTRLNSIITPEPPSDKITGYVAYMKLINGFEKTLYMTSEELKKIRQNCGVWAYPTYFTEINCITALQAQQDGLVPVVANLGALKETVGSGMSVDGNIKDTEVQKEFLEKLLYVMEEQEYWSIQSKKAQEFAKNYAWEKVSNEWISEFEKKDQNPLVSICTVTIREGFWNIMAENIAKQSYKNIEWIIVDDHKEDRSEIAKKYAKQYGITIRYLRGAFHLLSNPRRYGLVQANNIAWKAAKGELLVYLQDFILMPERGIEDLVTLYLHNPDSLLAPVDQYWFAKEPDQKNKEDWWNGNTDIIHSFSWRNVRVQFEGIRKTTDPFDFEMNYCAIPKRIIEHLNGWWEFFDDGLGYDNTEFASRALKLGCSILVDDTNIAKCINLWPVIGGTEQNIANRERYLATPYFKWLMIQMENGKMPVIRDEGIDKSIKLTFEVPKDVKDEDCAKWINDNTPSILESWKGGLA